MAAGDKTFSGVPLLLARSRSCVSSHLWITMGLQRDPICCGLSLWLGSLISTFVSLMWVGLVTGFLWYIMIALGKL
jgi:predicted small integral membrane protein